MAQIKPFKVDIAQSEVDRLYEKLRDTRVPTQDIVPGAGSDYGFPTEWATELYNYWLKSYSWQKAEDDLNQWPHFTTEIEDINVHFIHQKSAAPNAIPLLLVHGWPGSFHEFSEVINPLSDEKTGQRSFHCVVPSLPGFCWSSGPPQRGWKMKDTARLFHKLLERLGYDQYCVQAGDWGQFVARELGAQYSDHCQVIHLNYCPGAVPEGIEPTQREREIQARGVNWRTMHLGYATLMRTRPHCVGWMLQDNPVGLLAFVGEKYLELANPQKQVENSWKDHILTTLCLYYFSNCIMTSCLPLIENFNHEQFVTVAMKEENLIKCPFGYTSFAFDSAPSSKRGAERTGNLVWYRERDYAGHFACLEDAKGIVEDVREVIGKYWPH
ncbi:alpha/beta-hydrolase [Viridothelium virens]|uniref:Alpha/beta-hydrolase n=1 Tax=Viridothelium virens TaxID=1048519 RepID=A0A6A6H535_VIRVR|nr:alpha/beta-hydrolase [Viridothelium virens]